MIRRIFVGLWLLPLLLAAQGAMANVPDPLAQLQETSDKVLAEVTANKQELTDSPAKIYPLLEQIVLPKFDFELMSRMVLGKHWASASDAQKETFVKEFRELLVRTYATALLNYSGQKIEYQPVRMRPEDTKVTVDTMVTEGGAPGIPINYRLHLDGEKWLVYDVSIDGVSLVSNYRTSFSSQIRKYELQGLIEKLVEQNKQGQ